jgi:bacterioferritin-associated ferredoxin
VCVCVCVRNQRIGATARAAIKMLLALAQSLAG